jgi:hypothetical protein
VSFEETLAPTLSIRCAGAATSVPGANLKRIALDLFGHGFAGEVVFWVRADAAGDALHQVLVGAAPLEIDLTVAKARYLGDPPGPVSVRAAVTARRFTELVSEDVSGSPVLFRRYRLGVVDPARAAWSAHHPTVVRAGESLADLIAAQLVGELRCEVTWPELTRKRGLVCLGLGEDEASFHDFVAWLAAIWGGHFHLDYARQVYQLAERKPAVASPVAIPRDIVGELDVVPAEPPRHQLRLLNSWVNADAVTSVEQPQALPPLTRDVLIHTPLAREVEARGDRESRRHAAGLAEVELVCRRYPEILLVPGAGAQLDPDDFSPHLAAYGKPLRVVEVHLEARALDDSAEHDLDLDATTCSVDLRVRLEHEDDPRPRVPAHRVPRYPIQVEGRIVSALGDSGDRAYTVYEDDKTSLDRYRVLLPTWNATIDVPFTPLFQPGHLYFPAYRDARVLVAIGFDRAVLTGFLDWGDTVRLPLASQGNHILFGRNATSETSLRHWYVDSKPELQLRRAHAGDIGVVAVKQGAIVIETFDESAGGAAPPTVSVRPEAESAKAKTEATAEVAVADLEDGVQGSVAQLDGEVGAASAAVKQAAAELRTDVKVEADSASASLRGLADEAAAASERARGAVEDTRRRVAALFDGEE